MCIRDRKDPLLIYKFEAFELFKSMLNQLNREVLSFLIKGTLPNQNKEAIQEAKQTQSRRQYNTTKDEVLNSDQLAERNRQVGAGVSQAQRTPVETVVREQPKIGRNERVNIKNVTTGESKTVKFKLAEPLIKSGSWVITQ